MNKPILDKESIPPPVVMYRAYLLTETDRENLMRIFPTTHPRVIADHISAESLSHMHLVKEGAATGEVIGLSDSEGMQSLVIKVNDRILTSAGTPFHISWSAEFGVSTSMAGEMILKGGYTILPSPIKLDLTAGASYSAPLRNSERKDYKLSDYFKIEKADAIIQLGDIITSTPELGHPSVEKALGYMKKAADGKMEKRSPVSLQENGDGKYLVIDGYATIAALKIMGLTEIPANIDSIT